jgi:hypothetical protein
MAPFTDDQVHVIFARARKAVREAQQIRAVLDARAGVDDRRLASSEGAERRVIAEHRSALSRGRG